jgi:hypothetical protein
MKLYTLVREGNFNILNFSEKSISVHLKVEGCSEPIGEDGKNYINLYLRCEDGQHLIDWRDNPLNLVAELVYLAPKFRYHGDKEKFEKFRAFVDAHEDEIYQAWVSEEITRLTKRRYEMDKEIQRLSLTVEIAK